MNDADLEIRAHQLTERYEAAQLALKELKGDQGHPQWAETFLNARDAESALVNFRSYWRSAGHAMQDKEHPGWRPDDGSLNVSVQDNVDKTLHGSKGKNA